MNFGIDDEDPDFSLTPGARSRLSSLFQGQERTEEVPNQALMYTAPKQPKKQDQTASAPGQLKLIHAVAVHTYVLETGKYTSQGQAGAAILGNHETLEYKLLLYKGKQQRITCCALNANFSYRVQEQNYANFYDDRKVNWSIMFDSEKSSIEFAKQVALAKANSCGSNLNSTIIQDLTAGEGTVVLENGGSAEVYFVGWIFSNHALGDVFDSNMEAEKPLRFRMGKSKVIKGWSGLLGSKKGTKRLVIIPPAFAYGSEGIPDRVPPNAVVIFEFHIKKVKEAKDSPSLSQSPAKVDGDFTDKKPEISPKPHSQSITDETIRMRGASISEQLMQSPKKGNATIISRMAKMGTATLPLPGAVAAQLSSESEAEEECLSKSDPPTPPVPAARSRESSPKPVPKPRSSSGSGSAVVTHSVHPMPAHGVISQAHITQVSSSQQLPVYATASVPSHQHHVSDTFPLHVYPQATTHTAFPLMQPAYATHSLPAMSPTVVPSMTDSHLTLLLTETRSQNTEVRLSLSKISDKVETVLQKVEGIRSHEGSQSHSSLHYMESNVLVQNIQRIVQENTRLKEEVETKNTKIQSLNEKICDLLQKSQRFFEESNTYLEQRTESSLTQSRIFTLEQEKAKLSADIHGALSKVGVLETDLEISRKMENELSEKLKASQAECSLQQELVDSLKVQCSERENVISSLQRDLQEVEQEKTELLEKIHHLAQKLNDLELIKETLENTIRRKEVEIKVIKEKSESHLIDIKDSYKERESAASDADDALRQALQDKEDLQNKMKGLQSRCELLHEKSVKQKERFDSQVIELRNRMRQQLAQVSKAEVPPKVASSESDFDIKKTMNVLYRLLQSNIEVSGSYGGEEVLKICLETIRGLTVRVLSQRQKFQSAPNLENCDDSATYSTSDEGQRSDSTSLAVSPPKSSSVDSQPSEDQRPESSLPTASPPKSNTTLDSCEQTVGTIEPVPRGAESTSNLEETMNPEENSPLCETKSEGNVSEIKSEYINSELSSERREIQHTEISQVAESSQVQVEEVKPEPKIEPQASSDTVLQNGENKTNLEVQQPSTEDRKTPDQQSDALFVSEHKTEADDTSKASDLPNGPLKVWKPQPPPLPLFDDDEDADDWLK